ncbi:cytochrome P450 2K1-like [Sander lucioperca]|uniref:cytochrome P450 2K1-like n=1 Tax=Sander lucioperca TaxID=283035 RepID=UPI001653B29A|nr:cytochrome P450 2K1-like [Sander lucioperca]
MHFLRLPSNGDIHLQGIDEDATNEAIEDTTVGMNLSIKAKHALSRIVKVSSKILGDNDDGLVVLLLVYLVSFSSFSSKEDRKEPPGPKPFPLIGNLLQLDLKRPYNTLLKLSKTYGSVFTVYLGPQKVVVLAGYKTVKEVLVNYAEEFGERDPMLIMQESYQEHGKEKAF